VVIFMAVPTCIAKSALLKNSLPLQAGLAADAVAVFAAASSPTPDESDARNPGWKFAHGGTNTVR
jgi:hypothetical protein